jgi:dihydrodipicolinate synthase/N-acetylneuraminate lyase
MISLNETTSISMNTIVARIRPGRSIEGVSALLLPFNRDGRPDYDGLAAHLERTAKAGLIPAVNMDTGYVHLLTDTQRTQVLNVTRQVMAGRSFVAGAFVEGKAGSLIGRYRREIEAIETYGGTPIFFQCRELKGLARPEVIATYQQAAVDSPRLLAFELGEVFAPFGRIYDMETVQGIMEIENIVGIKHSSLNRQLEWERLALRDAIRPDFKIYTGNDLAIDMMMYGSDYLLGLSTFSPEAFALRDRWWATSDIRFYQLNDLLQYLGCFAFRAPTPAYRHSAAQFLRLMGQIAHDTVPPGSPGRPESDIATLTQIAEQLKEFLRSELK